MMRRVLAWILARLARLDRYGRSANQLGVLLELEGYGLHPRSDYHDD